MSQHKLAYKLASEGKSNADIWGALEITSGALQRLLQTDPKLLFSILQGRTEYIESLMSLIHSWSSGEDAAKHQYSATTLLLERAEAANRTLTVAHDMVLMAGTTQAATSAPRDAATVTSLLRHSKGS